MRLLSVTWVMTFSIVTYIIVSVFFSCSMRLKICYLEKSSSAYCTRQCIKLLIKHKCTENFLTKYVHT